MAEANLSTKADAKLLGHFAKLSLGFWTGPTRRQATLFVLGLFGCLVLNLIPAIAVNRWNKSFFDALQNKDHRLILFQHRPHAGPRFDFCIDERRTAANAHALPVALARVADADACAAVDGAPALLSAQRPSARR